MKLRVVVVDDETPICDWLVYCIRRASPDYEVRSAFNGEEACALIRSYKPDVVFTDICMPGMDGLELMRQVLETMPFTVFAILTNYAEFSYARQAVSLGAREYFLKSELRGADIEKLLAEVERSKEWFFRQKEQDTLPSGCIDLYNFYQDQEEPGYADRFWEKQGMLAGCPYLLLCVPSGKAQEDWRRLAELTRELRAEPGARRYTAVACQRDYEYIVLQAENALHREAEGLADRLAESGGVGVSSVLGERGEFLRAIRESTCALESRFFEESGGAVWFDTLRSRAPMDRELPQRWKREGMELLTRRQYGEAVQSLERCFAAFQRVGAEDVTWGIDYCRRIVLAVEEYCDQEEGASAQRIEVQHTLAQCRSRCQELIGRVQTLSGDRRSPSIETALRYIHEHYQEEISMAEVARQVYRSPEHFSRRFKEEVGENFSVYLTLYRLDRAQELLRRTDLRVAEVAERVGYTTAGYFSRLYKKYKGHTPEQERSKM